MYDLENSCHLGGLWPYGAREVASRQVVKAPIQKDLTGWLFLFLPSLPLLSPPPTPSPPAQSITKSSYLLAITSYIYRASITKVLTNGSFGGEATLCRK